MRELEQQIDSELRQKLKPSQLTKLGSNRPNSITFKATINNKDYVIKVIKPRK